MVVVPDRPVIRHWAISSSLPPEQWLWCMAELSYVTGSSAALGDRSSGRGALQSCDTSLGHLELLASKEVEHRSR